MKLALAESIVAEKKVERDDVLSETPKGGNEVENKSTQENESVKIGDGKRGDGRTEVLNPRSQLLTFTSAPTVAKRSNNRLFGVGIGHNNIEALRKLQKNQSELEWCF